MIFPDIVRLSLLTTLALVCAAPLDEPAVERRQSLAEVIGHCNAPNTVALTFDDGPFLYTYDLVNVLNKAGVKGTFFFNGNNFGCIYGGDNPDKVRYVFNNGHQAASHTWSHKNLTSLNQDMLHDEFYRVELALTRLVGVKPAFVRPPYGGYNDLVRQVASVRGQKLVTWDLDAGDGLGKPPAESKAIYDNVAQRRPLTILALNHETHERTVHEVIPYAIQRLKNAGYVLVTLAECLGLPPYQSVGPPQPGSWSC